MNIQLHFRIVGALLLLLAVMNIFLPRRFGWRNELARLSLLTRQIFIVHCLFIILVLILQGVLLLFFSQALLERSLLSELLLGALSFFWGVRLFCQLFVYDRALWLGDTFNTVMHVVFTSFWTYCTAVFGGALWIQTR